MAGKPQFTPDEYARFLVRMRKLTHLTFHQACRELDVSDASVRHQFDSVVPKMAKQRPDLDWSLPVFSGRNFDKPAVVGAVPTDSASEAINRKLKEELREARAKLASYDREYADHNFIKTKLFALKDQTVTPPNWLVKTKMARNSPGIPSCMWSDWHWGEVVDPKQINGKNEYNLAIAQARARRLVERTIMLLRSYMVSPSYEGVVINLGGDMLSGNIHEELVSTNAVPIMAAVVDIWGTLEWCLRQMADEFGKVAVFCVTGNHGRDTRKIPSKDRAFTSFDWLVYMHLQGAFKGDKRIQIMAPPSSDILYQVYNQRYLLTHGDQFRGGDGMIGHIGPVTRGQKKKLSRNAEIGQEFDTMVHGHFHTYAPGDRIIGNGSLVGYSEYADANNFSFEAPKQAMWITHPDHGITFHIPVFVDEAAPQAESAKWVQWLEAA